MKIGTTLFALFILSAFTSHLPSVTALVDTDGQPIRNGGIYYILPRLRGIGGGITQAATGNETCPLTVVQSSSVFSIGLPVQISSLARIMYLSESLIVDLEFAALQVCAPIPKWTIVDDGLPHGPSVKLVGYKNTVDGGFRIRSIGLFRGYKLVFCPTSTDTCSDIGVWVDPNGVRRLVVSDKINPLAVVFKNAGFVTAAAAGRTNF